LRPRVSDVTVTVWRVTDMGISSLNPPDVPVRVRR
jgi:hypothetical protein